MPPRYRNGAGGRIRGGTEVAGVRYGDYVAVASLTRAESSWRFATPSFR